MITRRNTIILAAFTAVCFVVAGLLGNDNEGAVQALADVAWFGLLLGALLLLVIGVARLTRWAAGRKATAR
jgi:predicted transporter